MSKHRCRPKAPHAFGAIAMASPTIASCPAIEHAPRPSWIPPNEFSGFATRLATHYSSSAILVIGANQGPTGTDPSFEILGGKDAEPRRSPERPGGGREQGNESVAERILHRE